MNPRLRMVITALAGGVAILALLHNRESAVPEDSGGETNTSRQLWPPSAPVLPVPATLVTLPIAETAAALNSVATTAEDDLATIELLFSDYQKQFGGNPVGENEEITAALSGRNPKHLAFLPAQGPFLDSEGRLIDRWGTPYFFHAVSGHRMEIFSSGPDRKLHTADDLKSEP